MATGSGTGTPAAGSSDATLNTLRDRIRTQLISASGDTDWTPVLASSLTLATLRERLQVVLRTSGESLLLESTPQAASAETLTTLRDRVETTLQDSGNAIWASGDIDEAIEQAIDMYSRSNPRRVIGTITLAAAGREISMATLTGLIAVERVWWDYDSSTPGYPPNWRNFRVWPGNILYVDDDEQPANTDVIRVWYTAMHTLNGLNAAGATTVPVDDLTFLLQGAAAIAARFRAVELAESATVDGQAQARLMDWAEAFYAQFEDGLRERRRTKRIYTAGDLDEGIRQAIEQYSRHLPSHAIGTVTVASDTREIDISSLTTLIRVEKIWWDYDSGTPGYPPAWRHFAIWPGSILYVDDREQPETNDVIRIYYTKEQTLNGLDSASATTFPVDDESFIISGAAAFAARFRAAAAGPGSKALLTWARTMMSEFTEGLRRRSRRYALAHNLDDIDEGLRWALGRYTEVLPQRAITSVTLSADGREVDISSITDYVDIERVWWNYDSSDPGYPPDWRDFELWAGDILFVKDGSEPQTGDVVRVWYTKNHALNGLDGASATSIRRDDETLLVTGGSGFCAQERVQDEASRYVPRKLREWADARLREFQRGLDRIARREASKASGIAAMPALDRWDNEGEKGWR